MIWEMSQSSRVGQSRIAPLTAATSKLETRRSKTYDIHYTVANPNRVKRQSVMQGQDTAKELGNIQSLTPDVFSRILRDHWQNDGAPPNVQSLSADRVDQGVLSQVYRVKVYYDDKTSQIPSVWIAKFCREDLDLGWMFQSEQAFYGYYGPNLVTDNLPFSIASPLSASGKHLILEYVTDSTCYDLLDGCPQDKIEFLTDSLACWHAQCWENPLFVSNDRNDLMNPPGMGQRLSPLKKEHLFASQWQTTLENVQFGEESSSLREFAHTFCEQMATLKLRDIHEKVHQERWTCVHGDYHIANWLFPKAGGRRPVLVDWSLTGYGNPMIDAVFFLVVSTNDDVVTNVNDWLEGYYRSLTRSKPDILSKISFATIREWFQFALLGQWMILVSYDEMCRQIAAAEPDILKRHSQQRHFENVNRRALLALKSIGNWDNILACLSKVTDEERREAGAFSKQMPLAI